MRRRRSGRRAETERANPTTDQGSERPEPSDPALDAALTDVVHRFLGITDQAENDLARSPDEAATGDAGEIADNASKDAHDLPADEPGEPARRRPQLRGRRRAHPDAGGTGGTGGTGAAGPGSGRDRRRTIRRVLPAALVAAALAVPGSGMLSGVTGLMEGDAGGIESELAVGEGGFLPIEDEPVSVEQFEDPEQLEAVPVGADPVAGPVADVLSGTEVVEELGDSGIPEVALQAYDRAADRLGDDRPSCGVRWSLLAAIGRVESNHGRFGGALLREDGYGTRRIRGIPLDGRPNVALIRDTDRGELDGDTTFDRAVGPMQFIPTTWRSVGVDANDDGRRDPDNMFDATQGAAGYLCAGGGDLRTLDDQARAVRRYNNADRYVRVVLGLARMYETGRVTPLPSLPALPAPPPLPQPQPTPAPPTPTTRPGAPATTTTTPPPTTTTTTTTAPPATTTTTAPTDPGPTTTVPVPPTTTTPGTPPTTVDPAPTDPRETPPASVGWAPAMREVVIGILEDEAPPPTTTTTTPTPAPTTTVPAEPACEPPAPATTEPGTTTPPGCTGGTAADAPATPPAGAGGEAAAPDDPATVPTST